MPLPDQKQPTHTQPAETGKVLEWRVHPVTRRPVISVIVTVAILAFSFFVFAWTGSRFLTAFSLVVLFLSLAKFYLPTLYRLTEQQVIVKTTTQTLRKDWTLFRSYYPDKNGVLLSPFVRPSRLENFRGQYLIFGGNRDEVLAFVKERIDAVTQHLRSAGPGAKS